MDFITKPRNDQEQLQKMASRLEVKLKKALNAVESLEVIALATASKFSNKTETVVYPCPSRIPKVVNRPAQPTGPPISYNRDQIEIVNSPPPVVVALEEDFGGVFYKQLKGLQYRPQGQSGGGGGSASSSSSLNFKRQFLLSPFDSAIDNSCPFYFDTRPLRYVIRALFLAIRPN